MANPYYAPFASNVPVNLPAINPLGALPVQSPQLPTAHLSRGGLFGTGIGRGADWGSAIQAGLAGFLANRNPGVSQYLFERLSLPQRLAQAQAERQQKLADEMSLIDYRATHPGQTALQQNIAALNAQSPGLGDRYASNFAAQGGASMIQYTDPTTGQRMAIPQPQLPAIGAVVDDPRKAGQASAPGNFPDLRPYGYVRY